MSTHNHQNEPVAVVVGAELTLDPRRLSARMMQSLTQRLTRANPEHEQRRRLNLDVDEIPARISFVKHRADGQISIPRGALPMLRAVASSLDVRLAFVNQTQQHRGSGCTVDELPITLRDYQIEAVDAMLRRVQGYVRLPCGAGKTVAGAAAIICSGASTIVLVHTVDLVQQWHDTFRKMYGVKPRGTSFGDRPWTPLKRGEIAVVMVQRLHRARQAAWKFIASAGCILLDECHHAPANTFREVFERAPARLRWGLTATPDRPDGWGFMLPLLIGPEVYGMTTRDLMDRGHLVDPYILPVRTRASFDAAGSQRRGRLNMGAAVSALCADESRTTLLLDIASLAAEHGRTTLLLVPRKAYAHQLAGKLRDRGFDAVAITSAVPKHRRAQHLRGLRERTVQIAVATQLADEGLDVPSLDMLICASTGRAAGRAIQRVGRVLRPAENKQAPIVIEIVDPGPFESQRRARRKAYLENLSIMVPDPIAIADALDRVRGAL